MILFLSENKTKTGLYWIHEVCLNENNFFLQYLWPLNLIRFAECVLLNVCLCTMWPQMSRRSTGSGVTDSWASMWLLGIQTWLPGKKYSTVKPWNPLLTLVFTDFKEYARGSYNKSHQYHLSIQLTMDKYIF